MGLRVLLRSHSLTPLRLHFGSPMLAKTSQAGTVRRNMFCNILVLSARPGLRPSGADIQFSRSMNSIERIKKRKEKEIWINNENLKYKVEK
jgi:hypothetical protein